MADHRYPHVTKLVMERPWAILPGTLAAIRELVLLRAAGERFSDEEVAERIGASPSRRRPARAGKVAVIPIYGTIVPRLDAMTKISGGTSIGELRDAFAQAMTEPDIGAVVFDVDSPGGSVDLVPEFAADVRGQRGRKPMLAVSNTMMASAAYWIASQADEVVASPSSLTGSIGVFTAHDDLSAADEKMGVKTTLISAGKYKAEATSYGPLSDDARAHIQSLVDSAYQMFTADVARGRRATVDAVRGGFGEGRVLTAKRAVSEGLADRVGTLEQTIMRAARLVEDSSAGRASLSVAVPAGVVELGAGAITPKSTATTQTAWDGPANKARLSNDRPETYRQAYAWYDDSAPDPDGDGYPDTKSAYKFIHHEVAANGDVGAANTNGCSAGIAVLNGGRGGANIPDGDRKGVWNHLARHIRDAGLEPPPLRSLSTIEDARGDSSFADEVEAVLCKADALVAKGRRLTAAKRHRLDALRERLDVLCQTSSGQAQDAQVAAMRMRIRLAEHATKG